MRNQVIVTGACVIVVAVLGYAWLAPSQTTASSHASAGDKAMPHAVQDLNSQVQRLSSEVAELREQPVQATAATPPLAAPAGALPPSQSVTDGIEDGQSPARDILADENSAPRNDREQRDRITQSLESRMASEDQDAAWGVNAESELTDGLQNAGLDNTALVGVTCRSTLCKVALTHTDFDAEDEFLGKLASLPGMQDTEIFYVRDEQADGSTQMVLYVGRQGYDMGL